MTKNRMSLSLRQLASGNAEVMRITVNQYHRMIESGILPEGAPYELIHGIILRKDRSAVGEDPVTVGHEHAWVITKLTALNAKLIRLGSHMRIQLPISLPPGNEPEPDGVIARGSHDDYLKKHPSASDVACLIEVADSSLPYDRTTKAGIYASALIAQYVIVNLPDRVIEVYTAPQKGGGKYGRIETVQRSGKVQLKIDGNREIEISARSLLP